MNSAKDYTVNVIYKNSDLETVNERSYSLNDYCVELKLALTRTIMDIESAFYKFEQGKNKSQWDKETADAFQHIRHKILDSANSIERLPQNLCCDGVNINNIKASDFIADVINTKYKTE